VPGDASRTPSANWPVKGRQVSVPTTQASWVTCSAGRRRSTDFCAITPDRPGQRGQQAQQHPGAVRTGGAGGGGADQHRAAERDPGADQQPAGQTLAQQTAGHQRDQDGTDVDQHRGGTRRRRAARRR